LRGIIIAGGEYLDSYSVVKNIINGVIDDCGFEFNDVCIISPHTSGASMLGERYAMENGVPLKLYRHEDFEYSREGRYIRNYNMIGEADVLITFPCSSRYTKHLIDEARERRLMIVHIAY
jgi:hypothetical protein